MDSQAMGISIILGTVIWLIIMYQLIKTAVASGTSRQIELLEIQNRMLIEILRDKGYSPEKIRRIHNEPNDPRYLDKLDQERQNDQGVAI